MFKKIANYLALAAAYMRFNLRSQMEYRGAFFSQVVAMFVNDCFWVIFWVLFFSRFQVLRGWNMNDVITVWAIAAAGFGLAHAACGNALYLPSLIARGQIDVWLLYPRALLSHIILGKTNASSWGDAIFGLVVYVVAIKPDVQHFALFVLLSLSAAVLFVGFSILSGSLGFYVGNSEVLSEQWRFSLLTFGTYPSTLFDGWVKILLYTFIPAAFISDLPVKALRTLSLGDAALAVLGSTAVLLVGVANFYVGLRRYESGNLMDMRG